MREWVAHFKFPGLELAYFGTFRAATEMEAVLAFNAGWRRVLPCEPPSHVVMMPGAIRLELHDE